MRLSSGTLGLLMIGLPGTYCPLTSTVLLAVNTIVWTSGQGSCPVIPGPILSFQSHLHMRSPTLMGGFLTPLYIRVPTGSMHLSTGSSLSYHLPDKEMRMFYFTQRLVC